MPIPDIRYAEQILFFLVFGIIIYGAFYESHDSVRNYKRGIQAGAFVLVAESLLKPYRGPFFRPNMAFWRGAAKFCLLYMVALVFLLFQTGNDARQLLKHLYPSLGQPVPHSMHTYDDNCELEVSNLVDNLDHYFAIHCINWFVASLLVRDAYVLHFWSILDEILELSWQHILPHFRECWWDHVILDVLASNTPAIFFGLWVGKKMGLQQYDWLGRKGKKSFKDWEVFKWFKNLYFYQYSFDFSLKCSHRRFAVVCAILVIMCSNFLTGFFLINSLWVPPQNNLNLYRLLVWFLLANLAFREGYTDMTTWGTKERRQNPISGKMRWLCCGITLLEFLISWKFRTDAGNMLDNPWPLYIVIPWTAVIVSGAIGYLYLRFKKDRTTIYGDMTLESEESADIGKDKALKEDLAKKEKKGEKKEEKVEKKEEKVETKGSEKSKKQKIK